VTVLDLGDGPFIVADREELAKFPLARRNNFTTTVSTRQTICIDAPKHALSSDANGTINLPKFSSFGSQKAGAVGGPNLTHNKATATSVSRKNGCKVNIIGSAGDDSNEKIDEKS
jgi:hypothetical protein